MPQAEDPSRRVPRDPTVSVCLVVHNEGRVIERCLRSLNGVDGEIVVVHDGACTDDTLDIARRYNARVFIRPFAGHSEHHRPFAYQQARGEWLLNVDADEFLSPEMAAVLPELMSRSGMAGYEFVWPLWDGLRPLTAGGPHRLVLMRRSATQMVGMIHRGPQVDGPIERRPEVLHHQPAYNNYTWKTTVTKQRRWARLHAGEMVRPFSEFPTFNYSGPSDWPKTRRLLNRLSPLLALPWGLTASIRLFMDDRWKISGAALRTRLRVSLFGGVYRGMVETYVARILYLEPLLKATGGSATAAGTDER